jgi:hypothetical protein
MPAARIIDHGAIPAQPKTKPPAERAPKSANGSGSVRPDPKRPGWYRIAVSIPGTSPPRRRTARARSQRQAAQELARLQREVAEVAPAKRPHPHAKTRT